MEVISNIFAFIFPMIIFAYWMVVGLATLSLLRSQRYLLQNTLLAPTIGFVMTIVMVFVLNRAGLPINQFADFLTLTLFVLSLFILWREKPIFPIRHYLPFLNIILLSLLLIAYPLLKFGFNWVSYANDDMANVCLGATFFKAHGYTSFPTINSLIQGQNYSLYYYFLYNVPSLVRAGSELLVAWCSQIFHLSPLQVFMPLTIALYMVFIGATAALVYQSRRFRVAALIISLLMAVSGLSALGVITQLIAQVGGLSIMMAVAILLLQKFSIHQSYYSLRQGLLISLVLSALLVFYPELLLIIVGSFLFYFCIQTFSGQLRQVVFWKTIIFTAALSIIILNTYWLNVVSSTIGQVHHGVSTDNTSLFPYFLIPNGVAVLWNLQALARGMSEPFMSLSIIAGFALLIYVAMNASQQSLKKYPIAIVTVVMLAVMFFLFLHHSAFGLFKIAMYLQPFIYGCLVIAFLESKKFRTIKKIILCFLILSSLSIEQYYIASSLGYIRGNSDLKNASALHLADELTKIAKQIPSYSSVGIDTPHVVAAKLLASYLVDKTVHFYSKPFFAKGNYTIGVAGNNNVTPILQAIFRDELSRSAALQTLNLQTLKEQQISLLDPINPRLIDTFYQPNFLLERNQYLILSTAKREMFNHREFKQDEESNFHLVPTAKVVNHLIFINSQLGQHYYFGDYQFISIFNLERDYYFPNRSVAAMGRYLLFRVVHPTEKTRIVIEMTTSANHDGKEHLPPVAIVGATRQNTPMTGSGSARIFVPIHDYKIIEGAPYLLVDMGRDGQHFKSKRTRLMKLYGQNVQSDSRSVIGLLRDISLINEGDYQQLNAPSSLSQFPQDLLNPNLEYSGFYENGFISQDAYFYLQEKPHDALVIKGEIPTLNKAFHTVLTLYLDKQKIAEKTLTPGEFMLRFSLPDESKRRKIYLHFSDVQKLDGHEIAAAIKLIGFIATHEREPK